MIYVSYYKSIIGLIEIKAYTHGIFSVNIVDKKEENFESNKVTEECVKQLDEYLKGKRREFNLPLTIYGTDFQMDVWNEVMCVPYGKTASYKDIAIRIGRDKAQRAVGTALNKTPILIIIPCHRIVGSSGGVKGFKYGMGTRKKLIELEKISLKN